MIELGGYGKLSADFLALEQMVKLPEKGTDIEELDFTTRQIIRKIESQRIDIDVFTEDDGERQLQDLQKLLKRNEYEDLCLDEQISAHLFQEMKRIFEVYLQNT